ncbi:MAG: hypothetical protein ACYC46_08495 [Acidobacteriaceae bacterium]
MFRYAFLFSVMALFVSLPASAAHAPDDFQFAHDVSVQHIQDGKNIVCFYCSVQIDGILKGNIAVFGGDLKINGKVSGNAVDFFGNTVIDGVISKNIAVFGGNLSLLQDAIIGKNAVVFGGNLHHHPTAIIANDEVVVLRFYFIIQLLLVLGILAAIGYSLSYLFRHVHRSDADENL